MVRGAAAMGERTAAALVAARRAEEDGPFSLLTPFPRCEYSSAAQLQTTLRQVT